jgi:hypothetical protein
VNFEKLKERLVREAKANPAKAAVLGGMFLVGIYFWAPLLASWMGGDKPAVAAKTPDPNADLIPTFIAMTTTATPDKTTAKEPAKIAWKTLAAWLDRDPRTNGTTVTAGQRDPFREVRPPEPEKKAPRPEAVAAPVRRRLSPEQLGMTLEGTLIGARQKTAVIDGRVYREGQPIERRIDERAMVFELHEVQRQYVVLTAENERYELRIPSFETSGAQEGSGNKR